MLIIKFCHTAKYFENYMKKNLIIPNNFRKSLNTNTNTFVFCPSNSTTWAGGGENLNALKCKCFDPVSVISSGHIRNFLYFVRALSGTSSNNIAVSYSTGDCFLIRRSIRKGPGSTSR